jgi:hypothetical protein
MVPSLFHTIAVAIGLLVLPLPVQAYTSGKTTKVNCAQSSTIKSNNFQLALFGLIGPKNQFGCFDRQKYDGP